MIVRATPKTPKYTQTQTPTQRQQRQKQQQQYTPREINRDGERTPQKEPQSPFEWRDTPRKT